MDFAMPYLIQTVRELTTKVEKLEEADAKRSTESAEQEAKPAMIMEPQLMLTAGRFKFVFDNLYCVYGSYIYYNNQIRKGL